MYGSPADFEISESSSVLWCTTVPQSSKTDYHISLQSLSVLDPSWQTLDCTPSFSRNWTVRVKVSLFTVGVLLKNEISGRITTREKGRILSCPNYSSIILRIICSVTNLDKSSSHFSGQRFYISV